MVFWTRKDADCLLEGLHRELVRRVECRNLVTLGQRRVVEDRGEKVVQASTETEHRLPDVKQLGGARPDDVHTEQCSVAAVEEHFEKAAVVAEDLAASYLAVAGDPDLVWHFPLRQRLLGRADHGDFR